MDMRSRLRTLCLMAACLIVLSTGLALAAHAWPILWTGTDKTPLRADRSGEAATLKDLTRGTPVRLLRSEGAWMLVEEPGGVKGWAYQGHLETQQPAPAAVDLFAPLPGSIVLAEAADTSRSSRSMQPVRGKDTEALWAVLELSLNRQNLEDFLREGAIGEYSRVAPHNNGGPLRLPQLKPAAAPGADAERLLGLNLAAAVVRKVAKPAFGMQIQRYVNLVGLSVARYAPGNALSYRFVVLDDATPLALNLPGGIVMLSSGLLRSLDNEAQLAAVLAHEAAHASLAHVWARAQATAFFRSGGSMTEEGVKSPLFAQMLEELLAVVLRQGYDQRQEADADAAAVRMAYRAGYDPLQLIAALHNVERAPGGSAAEACARWTDLHPTAGMRMGRIQTLLRQLPMQDGLALATLRFQANR